MLRATSLGLAGVILGIAACTTDSLTPDPCTGPAVKVTPDSVQLGVGDTVLMTVALIGPPECRPAFMTTRSIRWRTDDTSVARISPNKGYIVGRGPGVTNVITYYVTDETIWSITPVTVAP
jgi:hypothetical protein